MPNQSPSEPALRCSFCGKDQDQVRKMVSGPNAVFICDECVDLSMQIISEGTFNLRIGYWAYLFLAKLLYPIDRWRERKSKSRGTTEGANSA